MPRAVRLATRDVRYLVMWKAHLTGTCNVKHRPFLIYFLPFAKRLQFPYSVKPPKVSPQIKTHSVYLYTYSWQVNNYMYSFYLYMMWNRKKLVQIINSYFVLSTKDRFTILLFPPLISKKNGVISVIKENKRKFLEWEWIEIRRVGANSNESEWLWPLSGDTHGH